MKRILFLAIASISLTTVYAQWNINGNYTISGSVEVGTMTPGSVLHISGGMPAITLTDSDTPVSQSNPNWIIRAFDGGLFRIQTTTDFSSITDRMTLSTQGNMQIPGNFTSSSLDINQFGGSSGLNTGLRIKAGNSSSYFGNNQILFSYAQTNNYSHAIRSRHNAGNTAGNSIDFYVWKPGDTAGGVGANHVNVTQWGKCRYCNNITGA